MPWPCVTVPPRAKLPSIISPERLELMGEFAAHTPPGCFVEVGVYGGGSAQVLYEIAVWQDREIYLYDTFTGIPFKDAMDSHDVGDFAGVSAETIRRALPWAHVIEGVFPLSSVWMPPIAFVHADADQYRSTLAICRELGPLMIRGGMMLFDDYQCVKGCIAAVDECFPQREKLADGRALVRF